jgi:hypothetical protein
LASSVQTAFPAASEEVPAPLLTPGSVREFAGGGGPVAALGGTHLVVIVGWTPKKSVIWSVA